MVQSDLYLTTSGVSAPLRFLQRFRLVYLRTYGTMYGTRTPQAQHDETSKRCIETSVHPLGVPIRRGHRSGSDRLRRRPCPPDPDRRARRSAPAGSPRARADPTTDAYTDCYASTADQHAVSNAYSDRYASAAYQHAVLYTDADTADKHAVSNTYSYC